METIKTTFEYIPPLVGNVVREEVTLHICKGITEEKKKQLIGQAYEYWKNSKIKN